MNLFYFVESSFARVIVDKEILEDLVGNECENCGSTKLSKTWKTYGKGPSPNLEILCKKCKKTKEISTSRKWDGDHRRSLTYILMMLSILISGSTWTKTETFLSLMEINTGSKTIFFVNFQNKVNMAINEIMKNFIMDCRKQTLDPQDTFVIIDAGWSHPGWWARECSVTAIDGYTGLPIAVYHVIKGKNYDGSSKGMEGFGVLEIMKEIQAAGFKVTKVLHDKDSSTMKNVMEIFEDVQEALCISKYFHFVCHFVYMYIFSLIFLLIFVLIKL